MRIINILFVFILINSAVYSQNYYKLIGDTTYWSPGVIKRCQDGGTILTSQGYLKGYSASFNSICKMDSAFNIEWQRYFPDRGSKTLAVEASNGDFFFSFLNNITLRNEIARTDSAGNVLWIRAYPNSNPLLSNPILSLDIDNHDNLYLVYSGNQANRGLFAKLDSAGNYLWKHGFCTDLQGGDSFRMGRIGYDSSLYILGKDVNLLFQNNTILLKSDLDGNIKWVIGLPQDFEDFLCMPGGDLIVSGRPTNQGVHSHYPLGLIRIDSSGHFRSTIDLLSTNYHMISYSLASINGSTFQIMGSANTVPPAMIFNIPFKLTMDTTGNIYNSTFYNDTSFKAYTTWYSLTQVPDLSNFYRAVNGINYQVLIYDPDTNGICISSSFPVDSVFLDYSMIIDTMASVILPDNTNTKTTSITSFLSSYSREGCLVNQTNDLTTHTGMPLVYPIPFSNYVKFSLPNIDKYELQLFDISGKLIYRRNISLEFILDTRNYLEGVYLYVVSNSKDCFRGRIVK